MDFNVFKEKQDLLVFEYISNKGLITLTSFGKLFGLSYQKTIDLLHKNHYILKTKDKKIRPIEEHKQLFRLDTYIRDPLCGKHVYSETLKLTVFGAFRIYKEMKEKLKEQI